MTEFETSVKCFGLTTQPSLVSLASPSLTARLQTCGSAGRNDALKVGQSIGFAVFEEWLPNLMVKEMTERWMCALPENSGPQRWRSAPTLTLRWCVPKKW